MTAGLVACLVFALPAQGAKRPVVPLPSLTAVKGPDLPAVTSPTNARPIWTLDVNKGKDGRLMWQYAVVNTEGDRLATFGQVGAVSWSPDGSRYAFTSFNKWDGHQVNIKTAGGGQKNVSIMPPRTTIPWQIAWAPDGKQLAFLTYSREPQKKSTEYSLIIIKTEWGIANPFVAEFRVPVETLAGFPPLFAPPDKLRWSPNGQHILVSWGNAIAIDVRDGKQTVIHPERAAVAWTPRGDGVCYLALAGSESPKDRRWTGLYLRRLPDGQPVQLADAARLAELGLVRPVLNSGVLDFSPDGTAVALAATDGGAKCALHILAVDGDGTVQLDKPLTTIRNAGVVVSLDWAPDSQGLAVVSLPPVEITGNMFQMLEVTTTIYPRTGDGRKVLSQAQLPASPAYLDFLGSTKTLSWSH